MATPFDAGMFTTPEQIRSDRLAALQQQNTQRMSLPLLQQVAAGRGDMLAEGVAGLFGLKTPEEMKAGKVQQLMATLKDSDDPNAYKAVAKQLNDMGYIKEAIAVMGMGSEKLKEKQATALHGANLASLEQQVAASKATVRNAAAEERRRALAQTRSEKIDDLLKGLEMGTDTSAYFRSAADLLAKNRFAAEAADYRKLAFDTKEDRYMPAGGKIFDTQTGKYVEGTPDPIKLEEGEFKYYVNNMNLASDATTIVQQTEDIMSTIESAGVDMSAGIPANIETSLKNAFGERDITSEVNTMIESIRTKEAFKNLPPGPATEREVEGAFRTVPPDNAPLVEKVRWLERAERSNRIVARFRELENQWIEKNGRVFGLSSNRVALMEQAVKDVDAARGKKNAQPSTDELQSELDALRGPQ